MKHLKIAGAAVLAAAALTATPAFAEDAPGPITVSGSVALVNEYRFRGVSQSDRNMAIQAGATISHESGFYVATWGSNLAGWGTFGGSNMELDIVAGFKTEISPGLTVDVGATWYMYPGGFDNTDFIEPYVKLSGALGPVGVTVGVAYAPKQEALGAWYANGFEACCVGYSNEGDKNDNLYIWTDVSAAIPSTPVTLKAHIGYSKGNDGLGPFATSVAPTGEYLDWLIGADVAIPGTPVTLGVAYVDTDITKKEAAYLQPSFSRGQDGTGSIAGGTVLFSGTVAF
ncbi:TorF family putative porin [Novosphingobium colocasiae]|uniref:TorF family putative porin n=1 Tax=Novosphingobium colocasiae TaxID=1256513 RepID=UPI0035B344D0